MSKCRHAVTIIKRSCITGKPVWIYQGPSHAAARLAYWKACKKEIYRVRHWAEIVEERRRAVARFIEKCMGSLPLTYEMTEKQKEAARELQRMEKMDMPCHMDFYDHIMEEMKRKNERSGRWREARNKILEGNL